MNKRRSVFCLLIALSCGICRANDLVGELAPEIKIKSWVTNNPPDLRSLDGKVRVLDFWATWCGPCVANIPHLVKLYGKYKPMGVEFVALSQDKSADKVRKLVREKKMNYLVAIDDGTVDRFKINSYPTVVVIGHTGKVIWCGFPWDSKFERAIADAAKAYSSQAKNTAPCPSGYLKIDLANANTFIKPYCGTELAFFNACEIRTPDIASMGKNTVQIDREERVLCILQMIAIINQRIFDMYVDIATKYGSIEVVEPAKTDYLKLKNSPDSRELSSEFLYSYDWLTGPVASMQNSRQY
jgi:thiol-disulfide isomerase/thioredoxin